MHANTPITTGPGRFSPRPAWPDQVARRFTGSSVAAKDAVRACPALLAGVAPAAPGFGLSSPHLVRPVAVRVAVLRHPRPAAKLSVALARIARRRHAGSLYYEQRQFFSWDREDCELAARHARPGPRLRNDR
jgi:hypothetical protein